MSFPSACMEHVRLKGPFDEALQADAAITLNAEQNCSDLRLWHVHEDFRGVQSDIMNVTECDIIQISHVMCL